MRLELADFPVKEIQFGKQIEYRDGVLEVNRDRLMDLVLEDRRVKSSELLVAFPGERTRIVNTCDVVEPRIKVSGGGCVFPGILGPIEPVGEGRTNRLSGLTVMPSADYRPTILGGAIAHKGGIVDMWEPGSLLTPFGSTINIVLKMNLIDGLTEVEAHDAIQSAELKVARRLAESTKDRTPQRIEVFDTDAADHSLPPVVYILGCVTQWHAPHSGVAYYGVPIRESLPTFVYPTEFFDGVLTTDARRGSGTWPVTWLYMNNAAIIGLLREHDKSLNFLGVILQRTRFETQAAKLSSALCTAQMASRLGARAAIITRNTPSGNNFMDTMLTIQACEKKGIKTVLLSPEAGGDGNEPPLVFSVPEATGIVTTGSFDRDFELPSPEKVIGARISDGQVLLQPGSAALNPYAQLRVTQHEIPGMIDYFGELNYTCAEY